MAITLVASGMATASNTPQVSNLDMTGASLLVMLISRYTAGPAYTPLDDLGNTWNGLTEYVETAGTQGCKLFYAWNPTVSATQDFSNNASGVYSTVLVLGFAGVHTASDPYNSDVTGVSNVLTSATTPMQPGSVTVAAGDLAVTGLSQFPDIPLSWSIDSSFAITQQNAGVGGTYFGGAAAYWINGGGSASVNPNWQPGSANVQACATIATFRAASGAPAAGYLLIKN